MWAVYLLRLLRGGKLREEGSPRIGKFNMTAQARRACFDFVRPALNRVKLLVCDAIVASSSSGGGGLRGAGRAQFLGQRKVSALPWQQ
jgi:hypothetical protein